MLRIWEAASFKCAVQRGHSRSLQRQRNTVNAKLAAGAIAPISQLGLVPSTAAFTAPTALIDSLLILMNPKNLGRRIELIA